MLSVNINRDVEQYEETVAFGLNASQAIAAVLAIILCAGITCLLHFGAGLSAGISIYISLPFCIPVMLPTLGRRHGLTVTEQIRKTNKRKNVLAYAAVIPEGQEDRERQKNDAERKNKGNRKEKKNPKTRQVPKNQK